jgi:hypothetical protein
MDRYLLYSRLQKLQRNLSIDTVISFNLASFFCWTNPLDGSLEYYFINHCDRDLPIDMGAHNIIQLQMDARNLMCSQNIS